MGGGLRAHVVLDRAPGLAPVYRLPLKLNGVQARERSDGSVVFTDPGNAKPVFEMGAPIMWDARTDNSGDPEVKLPVDSRLVDTGSGRVVELRPDPGFLRDAVFPVTVDPTVVQVGRVTDTYVKSNVAAGRGSEPVLWAGRFDDGAVARALVAFQDPGVVLPEGAVFESASLELFTYQTPSCVPTQLNAKRTTGAWSAGTTWADQPPATAVGMGVKSFAHGFDQVLCPNDFESMDVSGVVSDWLGGAANHGLKLEANNEADTSGQKRFCSINEDPAHFACNTVTRNPTLSITFDAQPEAFEFEAGPHGSYLRPYPSESTGDTTPALHARCVDPEGPTCWAQFHVFNADGSEIPTAGGEGAHVPSGQVSTFTVPASAGLQPDAVYRWQAQADDGSRLGGTTQVRRFHTGDPSTIGVERRYSFDAVRQLSSRQSAMVNVATGNLLLHETDLQIKGTGLDLVVDRYYNSRDTTDGPLGPGWRLGIGHDVRVDELADGSVRYTAPSGARSVFTKHTTGFANPPGIDANLELDTAAGEYVMSFHSGAKYVFDAANGRQKRIEDRHGNQIVMAYNADGFVSQVTDTQGRVIDFTYTSGKLTTLGYLDGGGFAETNTYTYTTGANAGKLETVTISDDPNVAPTRYRYNADIVDQITTAAGLQGDFVYDTSRRLTSLTLKDTGLSQPESATYGFNYVSATQTKVTDPNGSATATDPNDGVTTYTVDDRGRVTKAVDALGHTQDKSYSSGDNIARLTDATQNITASGWDRDSNNLESVQLPTGAETQLDYSSTANRHAPTTVTDPEGRSRSYAYTAVGSLDTVAFGGSNQLLRDIDYLANGNVDKVTELHGVPGNTSQVVTDYTYDADGNLTGVNNPGPLGDVTIVPDALSRTNRVTDGKGQLTDYDYSAPFDPIANIDVAGGTAGVAEYVFDYDDDGNLTQLTDPNGVTTYSIDKLNRNLASRTSGAENIAYDYDKNGNLLKLTDANGETIYGYDQVNRLQTVREPGQPADGSADVEFDYDNNNRRTAARFPTSPQVSVDYTYDGSGRAKTITATRAGSPAGGLFNVTYDYTTSALDTGMVHSTSGTDGNLTYSYGPQARLTGVTGAITRDYDYDLTGNRTRAVEGATTTCPASRSWLRILDLRVGSSRSWWGV
ncbi:MAG: DUF6531 domain-containing protein [Micromonosporaceae bacterium]